MAVCEVCGADPDRPLGPFERAHVLTPNATDVEHLRPGAQCFSVDIGQKRRIELNRIAKATGLNVTEQIRRALDGWIAERRVHVEPAGTGADASELAAGRR